MEHIERHLLSLMVIVLSSILTGAFFYQFATGEQPCPLCELQRLGMIGCATGAMLNVRFGIRTQHYALVILSALFGAAVSFRQIALHICPGFPTFGEPVMGLSLYTWAGLSFVIVIFAVAVLLLFHRPATRPFKMTAFDKMAFGFIFLLATANVVGTLAICGLTACAG